RSLAEPLEERGIYARGGDRFDLPVDLLCDCLELLCESKSVSHAWSFPCHLRDGDVDIRIDTALYLERPFLLVACDRGHISFWAFCESQSLCRLYGIAHSDSGSAHYHSCNPWRAAATLCVCGDDDGSGSR